MWRLLCSEVGGPLERIADLADACLPKVRADDLHTER
jgi:hypothetical protein